MFRSDWFYSVLASLGLWQKEAKILLLGRDNAGKTTLLHMLKDERLVQHQPARYPNLEGFFRHSWLESSVLPLALLRDRYVEKVWKRYHANRVEQCQAMQYPTSEEHNIGKIKFKFFDLGGIVHRVLMDYPAKIDAVVYVVDACVKESFAESNEELHELLTNEALANVPFLVLGNNIDIPIAASEDWLVDCLGLADTNHHPLKVFMCSIVCKTGYGDGFEWLSQYIK